MALGRFDQPQLRFEDDAERAFRADEEMREVGHLPSRKHGSLLCAAAAKAVEIVPADAAQDFRKAAVDLVRVFRRQLPDDAIDVAFAILLAAFRFQLGVRPGAGVR